MMVLEYEQHIFEAMWQKRNLKGRALDDLDQLKGRCDCEYSEERTYRSGFQNPVRRTMWTASSSAVIYNMAVRYLSSLYQGLHHSRLVWQIHYKCLVPIPAVRAKKKLQRDIRPSYLMKRRLCDFLTAMQGL